MPPFNIRPRALRPTGSLLRSGYATRQRTPKRGSVPRRPPPISSSQHSAFGQRKQQPAPQKPSKSDQGPENTKQAEEKKKSSVDAVSSALHDANPENNNLLAPVHIPEDPNGVLNESHPATNILKNSAIVVTRQLELMNVMLGFEQANKYVIMDPHGQHIGFMAEKDLGMGNMFKRQMFSTHRSFTTHVFDKFGKEVLRFHRPFSWISSRIGVYDPLLPSEYVPSSSTDISPILPNGLSTEINQDTARISQLPLSEMRIIGEAQQHWAPLRRKYNLFLHRQTPDPEAPQLTSGDLPLSNTQALQPVSPDAAPAEGQYGQFAYVDEPFLSWDFSLLTSDSKLLGSVNRNFSGFGREIFTDTGVYALRMDAAGLSMEPGHLISKTGKQTEVHEGPGMTLDQRAIMLATAVSVDFDYFSRKSGGSGMMGGMWPLWLPGGGGGAAGAEAGAEAGAAEAGVEGGAAAEGGAMEGTAGEEAAPPPSSSWPGDAPPEQPGGGPGGDGEQVWGWGENDPGTQGGNSGGEEGGGLGGLLSDLWGE